VSFLYRFGARLRLLEAVERVGMGRALRDARRRAVELAVPGPGARVLDVACGSGPLLPALAERAGPDGLVVGVDPSAPLLDQAQRRTRALGNVKLRRVAWPALLDEVPFDGAVCCLGMSVIPDWRDGLEALVASVRPGGPVVVVDWLLDPGQPAPLRAYIRAGSAVAGADPARDVVGAASELLRDARVERLPMGLWLAAGSVAFTNPVTPAWQATTAGPVGPRERHALRGCG
jgi:SAM-dependent methyltransferase